MEHTMTVEDCTYHEFGPTTQARVRQLIDAAVAAERERCIGLCHLKLNEAYTRILHSEGWSNTEVIAFTTAAESIAAAILDA